MGRRASVSIVFTDMGDGYSTAINGEGIPLFALVGLIEDAKEAVIKSAADQFINSQKEVGKMAGKKAAKKKVVKKVKKVKKVQ